MIGMSSEGIDVLVTSQFCPDTLIQDEAKKRATTDTTTRDFCMRYVLNQMINLSLYKYFLIKVQYDRKKKRLGGIPSDKQTWVAKEPPFLGYFTVDLICHGWVLIHIIDNVGPMGLPKVHHPIMVGFEEQPFQVPP